MSIQHFALFWAHSQSTGFARLVGVELAQRTSFSTGLAWPSRQLIAQGANGSTRSVTRGLAELVEELGEFEEIVMDDGRRAWRMVLACPDDCEGAPAHKTRSAWDARTENRERERERRAAARAARRTSEGPQIRSIEEVIEGPLQELSETIQQPGQDENLEALSETTCLGHEGSDPTVRSVVRDNVSRTDGADRSVVRDILSPVSETDCLGQAPDTSYRELEVGTTTRTGDETGLAVEGARLEASPGGAAGGGGDARGDDVEGVLEALPETLRRQIPTSRLEGYVGEALERGVPAVSLAALARLRSWDGARAGAVVAWLRDIGPGDVPEPRAARPAATCSVHDGVKLVAGRCPSCTEESRARGQHADTRPRPGESLTDWSERVAQTTSSH